MAYCYFDGEIVDERKATVSIHNLGLQRGFGVFDLFRGRDSKPVFMEDHLDRFQTSQKHMELGRTVSGNLIREAVEALQQKNRFTESSFKLMLLGSGSEYEEELEPLFFVINTSLRDHHNPEVATVLLHEYVRENPAIKSINYYTSQRLHKEKKKIGAIDVIYHYHDEVSEASRSNVVLVRDGHLYTPEKNILHGVTRKNILAAVTPLAPVHFENFSPETLLMADEIFLCSTLKEIMPVTKIGDRIIGGGKCGPVTKKVQETFKEICHS